ncbi:response regulator [Pedobacter sp. JCM 36344]|uniref:response regulator n=1 Tax=Pedobacter sp. JCM 36344 TaxID=3374280 RepID=UPI00397B3B41
MLIKLGLVEDDSILLDNYREFFGGDDTFEVVFSIRDLKELSKLKSCDRPDIILLDLMLPSGNSLDQIHVIKQFFPKASIIIFSSVSEPNISRMALYKGANGFLLKSSSLQFIKDALHKAFEGGIPLSPSIVNHLLEVRQVAQSLKEAYPKLTKREVELIYLLKTGMSNKMAASMLKVTFFTINHHAKNIYRKLKIHSKSELIAITTNF